MTKDEKIRKVYMPVSLSYFSVVKYISCRLYVVVRVAKLVAD